MPTKRQVRNIGRNPYDHLTDLLKGRSAATICNNTVGMIEDDHTSSTGERIDVRLHGHHILSVYPDRVILWSRGYRSVTTKDRLNLFLPGRIGVFQRDFEWFVNTSDDETVPFEEGIEVIL